MNKVLEQMYRKKIESDPEFTTLLSRTDHSAIQDEAVSLVDALYRGDYDQCRSADLLKDVAELAPLMRKCRSNLYKSLQTAKRIVAGLIQHTDELHAGDMDQFEKFLDWLYGEPNEQEMSDDNMQHAVNGFGYSPKLAQTIEEGDEQDDLVCLFSPPGTMATDPKPISPTLIKQLSERLAVDIIEWYGRFDKFIVDAEKKRVEEGENDVKDVVLGNDLPSILEDQFIDLMDEDLEILFYQNYIDEELLQFEMKNVISEDKGPIILFVDTSGSMSSLLPMAYGFALAIARRLSDLDRRVVVATYTTDCDTIWDSSQESLFDLLAKFLTARSGGTALTRALPTFFHTMFTDRVMLDKADIVVISDGQDALDEMPSSVKRYKELYNFEMNLLWVGNVTAHKKQLEEKSFFDSILTVTRPDESAPVASGEQMATHNMLLRVTKGLI